MLNQLQIKRLNLSLIKQKLKPPISLFSNRGFLILFFVNIQKKPLQIVTAFIFNNLNALIFIFMPNKIKPKRNCSLVIKCLLKTTPFLMAVMTISYYLKLPHFICLISFVLVVLAVMVFLAFYLYCYINNPDSLRFEKFWIK